MAASSPWSRCRARGDPALGKQPSDPRGKLPDSPAGLIDPEWTFARLRSIAALEPRRGASKRRPALLLRTGELTAAKNRPVYHRARAMSSKGACTRPCSAPSPVAELASGHSCERACLVDITRASPSAFGIRARATCGSDPLDKGLADPGKAQPLRAALRLRPLSLRLSLPTAAERLDPARGALKPSAEQAL